VASRSHQASSSHLPKLRRLSACRRAVSKSPLRFVRGYVHSVGGQSADRMFMHRRASGAHPDLPR